MFEETPWAPPAVNHVEMVYRPGERQLALRLLETLGCATMDSGGIWARALVDAGRTELAGDSNNVLYVSEVTPEQWALEQALDESLSVGALHGPWSDYARRLRTEPQRSSHFGIRCPDRDSFDARLDAVRSAGAEGDLKGRVELVGLYFPGDPGFVSPRLAQAFVWTDVIASGILAFGQHIEVQLYVG
jgi:hypothetical protein